MTPTDYGKTLRSSLCPPERLLMHTTRVAPRATVWLPLAPWLVMALLPVMAVAASADTPPEPPAGYRWVKNDAFSDEFNGTELDPTKWHDHNPRWKGRPPGKFMPESVSVADGCLRIRCTPLAEPIGDFTIACGAVQSKDTDALFGYYECRMKASSLTTSSTFWLNSHESKPIRYGEINLELDIQECIGNAKRWPSFSKRMHSNTHIKLTPNEEGEALLIQMASADPSLQEKLAKLADMDEAERAGAFAKIQADRRVLKQNGLTKLSTPVNEAFHTYGCWWVDANTMHFYADGEFAYTIKPKTGFDPKPFDQPMFMNLLCETYSWEVAPTTAELEDDRLNTTLYDYVRSYRLVPATE